MKCIRKNNTIKRVTDSVARSHVAAGWRYCDKSLWKLHGRKDEIVIEEQ
jgi:hypothetical protein